MKVVRVADFLVNVVTGVVQLRVKHISFTDILIQFGEINADLNSTPFGFFK